jgi:hypothetical protein
MLTEEHKQQRVACALIFLMRYHKKGDGMLSRIVTGDETSVSHITYLLTLWSRVLLEKLTVNFAASQEIPRIYGTRKFLTVPTSARHLSLS